MNYLLTLCGIRCNMLRSLVLLLIPFFFLQNLAAQDAATYALEQRQWVEDRMKEMNRKQRIGQLFMVAAHPEKGAEGMARVKKLIRDHNIGGLIFFKGTALEQAKQTNEYQNLAQIPLLISIDGEWGLNMRIKDTPKFPRQLMLGAIQDDQLLYDMGKEVARHCKRMGIHINLAPVVDVNNNPNNPVINDRSFGESRINVAKKGVAYMQGMEMNGIMACAKHFPGHGDTDQDSHKTLPIIRHEESRLDSIELYPFKEMIKRGVSGMMIAHLSIPAYDGTPVNGLIDPSSPTMPATLSKGIVTNLLRNQLGYDGLIFTDALNMKGVSKYFEPGEVDLKALLAGNDVLLFPEDVDRAVKEILNAVEQGLISMEEIDRRVEKILKAKYKVGLNEKPKVILDNLVEELNQPAIHVLIRKLIAEALTVARNDHQLLPIREMKGKRFASLAIGTEEVNAFQKTLGKYTLFDHYNIPKDATPAKFAEIFDKVKGYDEIVIGIHDMSRYAKKQYGLTQSSLDLIQQLQQSSNVVLTIFGSPYSLRYFEQSPTTIVAYQDTEDTQNLTAQMVFGAIPAKGKLPVSASLVYPYGQGVMTPALQRLQYGIPEEVGLDSEKLRRIDDFVGEAMRAQATPGAQVLVAKDGVVVFEKAYGYHTYKKKRAVELTDIYDLASLTKINASMLGIMDMYEDRAISLDSKMGQLIPSIQGTNKAKLEVRKVLTHTAGLTAWIPFYEETLSQRDAIYSKKPLENYSIEVAEEMYMRDSYLQDMQKVLLDSDLPNKRRYKYSDLGFYLFKQIIEGYAKKPMQDYLEDRFYDEIGIPSLTFLPREKFPLDMIVPTEQDDKFRKQLLRGHVHDMGAAMQGGVGGHAGLFGSANDVAILMELFLNRGFYGGKSYFEESTIDLFTSKQYPDCRRGLGFDKPTEPHVDGPTGKLVSPGTYGHSGFTGTCAWVDPTHNLVYVFISNRIHPNMNNTKLWSMDTRTKIQDAIYKAMEPTIK